VPWGVNEFLTDRARRETWLRRIALTNLADGILATRATAREAVGCFLDELFGDRQPVATATITRRVKADVARIDKHVRARFTAAKKQRARFQALALVLSDTAPYQLRLALVDAPMDNDEWVDSIVWNDRSSVGLTLLDDLLPRVPANKLRIVDYILPLTYAAIVLREVTRQRGAAHWKPAAEAAVTYSGGDWLAVPID
jgi:hypothetical protein